ncbi:phosphoribosylglycinamide formyltransferase [Akkermansiaceae bacterium]|nr:phosphoribosylglycinamide formyltransferase [Akkermansiaceae bacterium]
MRCFCWIPFMAKIAVLGSGTGSNFQALVEEFGDEIVLVISDQPGAGILEKAKAFGIPTAVEVGGADLSARILKRLGGVDLICLAGYMRLVKEPLLSAFPNRILNIHPSLLPKYPGKAAWEQALADQAEVTGCTVHYVDAGIDTGEVILQEKVAVLIDDTATALHARIQIAEHRVYPQAVKWVLKKMSGRV